ncbi:uncharacterized protein LACBIDRAFT_304388 [Laccaria bicolor S238N-H82]|uniref:Predicted protein n=1 Tax=Laccaria bicolor (strain S238N-H82 / ATCC MYA-4686) TaxID=486041 RepID=B0DLJ1_LACBS|nr:uncharacterized protein LACBIDRAFT_304388 [Laccaria bicolor S238N-H82]EDR04577.1 predicted protein [Laccaria bicolor S238N-H82]|eukprot:XP_001884749.1 predicted protein [Laccaria bicolor S238N-H82]
MFLSPFYRTRWRSGDMMEPHLRPERKPRRPFSTTRGRRKWLLAATAGQRSDN